jgi:hypothetical protein
MSPHRELRRKAASRRPHVEKNEITGRPRANLRQPSLARDILAKDVRAPIPDPAALDQLREQIRELGRREFLDRFGKLGKEFSSDAGNPGSYACEGCERCANCMFCKECVGCYQCTHCTRCESCNNCSHCVDSKNCHGCAYCVQSENCAQSAYLVLCRNLSDCNYCFGCVGLAKKDFHILNVPFVRTEYFQIVNKLRKELDLR